jgi:class 3 adenylate cyclase
VINFTYSSLAHWLDPRRTTVAKFLRIGVHHSNVSGYTSKAWSIRRVGTTALLKWGVVEVRGVGRNRRVYWAVPPREKTVRCRTAQRTRAYVKKAIARRINHRYERLPDSVPIRPRPARGSAEFARALATILFVDIVGSTAKAAQLGDRRWTEVLNHYYAAVRGALRTNRGTEIITTGDGMLATFEMPTAAIRCAAAIRHAVRTLGLEIRAGLHTGEYKMMGSNVVGIAVHIGARVAAKAGASEVLVSSAVRDRVDGSAIRFKDRGVHKLKGVPTGWRLYLVEP